MDNYLGTSDEARRKSAENAIHDEERYWSSLKRSLHGEHSDQTHDWGAILKLMNRNRSFTPEKGNQPEPKE